MFVRPQGTRSLEGSATRRYLSPSREVAAAIPRSRERAATHAGVDRRWHAVCDTEGIDERHTGARLHGGTRDPRRGVTEGQSSVSPASGNCSGTRGTSARHTGARAVFPGFKPLNLGTMSTLSVDVERVTLNGVTSSVRRSCPRPFSQKPRSNVPKAPVRNTFLFRVDQHVMDPPPGKCSTRRRPSRHPRVSTETRRAPLPRTHSHSPTFPHSSIDRTNPRRWAARRTPRRLNPHSPRTG